VLLLDVVLTAIFLEESHEGAKDLPSFGTRLKSVFTWLWHVTSAARPSYLGHHFTQPHQSLHQADNDSAGAVADADVMAPSSLPTLLPDHTEELKSQDVLTQDTICLLSSYLVFQFSSVSFNSLYPIFGQSPVPTGRNLAPTEIGLSLSFAGVVTIAFQVGIFGKLRDALGNKTTYRWAFAGFTLAFWLMPWVGYEDDRAPFGLGQGRQWLWLELCVILLIKTVATVGGLTSALLLVSLSPPQLTGTVSAGAPLASPLYSC
jgi:hypothetical protein